MAGKKYKTVQLSKIYFSNCELPISDFEEMFNKIKQEFSEYQNLSVDFHEYYPGSDYDGEEDAHAIFYGDRLETDDECAKRLKQEEEYEKRRIKYEKDEQKRKEKIAREMEQWEKSEYKRLKKKYGT